MTPRPHTHDDHNRLTFGCPARTDRVHQDQENARWRDAPVRRCTWSYRAAGEWHQFTVDQRVPVGADAWQVSDRYLATQYARVLRDELPHLGFNPVHWSSAVTRTLKCVTIGPMVEDVAAPTPMDHPSLFGGDAA